MASSSGDREHVLREAGAATYIDQVCDVFVRAWRSGPRPTIEEFLFRATAVERHELLLELLCEELSLKQQAGESALIEEYRTRFPEDREVVAKAFALKIESTADEKVSELVRRWQKCWQEGRDIHVEELCHDCPEFVTDVRRRIAALVARAASLNLPDRAAPTPHAQSATANSQQDSHRYHIRRFHAQGGLGRVSIALDGQLNREVAYKEIRTDRDSDGSRLRFVTEAEITGGLEHPGVVPIYSLGHDAKNRPFYAMRLIHGRSLAESLNCLHTGGIVETPTAAQVDASPQWDRPTETHMYDSTGVAPPNELPTTVGPTTIVASRRSAAVDFQGGAFRKLLQRFIAICNTVEYAHQRGVIHRDIKPANIMLGDFGETLLVDWGLAKAISRPRASSVKDEPHHLAPDSRDSTWQTQVGQIVGTPSFMSPEQAAGATDLHGPASDVFGLGATLYQILVGRPFVSASTVQDMLRAIVQGDWLPPRDVDSRIPLALDAICRRAMAVKPTDRYPTALALAADLEHWLADEPVSVMADPIHSRIRRWGRKHPSLVVGISMTVVLGLTGLTLGSWMLSMKNRQLTNLNGQLASLNQKLDSTNRELTRSNQRLGDANKALTTSNENLGRARQRAVEAHLIAKSVRDFLTDRLLRQADPRHQPRFLASSGVSAVVRDNPTIRELLDRAATELESDAIESQFAGQPAVQAELLSTIGASYRAVGAVDEAIDHLKRAVAIRAAIADRSADLDLDANHELAMALADAGRFEEAIALIDVAAEEPPASDLKSRVRWSRARNNLAYCFFGAGQHERAIELLLPVWRAMADSRVSLDSDSLMFGNNLATALHRLGRTAEAIVTFEQALKQFGTVLDPEHPDITLTRVNLAMALSTTDRRSEALEMLRHAATQLERQRGASHPYTVSTRTHLALQLLQQGNVSEAVEQCEPLYDLLIHELGPDDPQVWSIETSYGEALRRSRRLDEAIRLLEHAYRSRLAKLGRSHHDTLVSLNNLAMSYVDQQRLDDALELLEEGCAAIRESNQVESPLAISLLQNLGVIYARLRRHDQAIEALSQARDRALAKNGPTDKSTIECTGSLANVFSVANRLDEATATLTPLYDALAMAFGDRDPRTFSVLDNLAWYRQKAGDVPRAIELTERFRDAVGEVDGPNRELALIARFRLGTLYRQAERQEEATTLLQEIADQRKKPLGAERGVVAMASESLAQIRLAAKRPDEAAELLEWVVMNRRAARPVDIVALRRGLHNLAAAKLGQSLVPAATQLLEEVLALDTQLHGPDAPVTRRTRGNVMKLCLKIGEFAAAERHARYELKVARASKATTDVELEDLLGLLVVSLIDQKKWSDVEPILLEQLTLERKRAPDQWEQFLTESHLGAALIGQKKYDDAEQRLLAAYAGMKARETQIPAAAKFRLAEVVDRLVELYVATDRSEEAANWRARRPTTEPAREP